MDAAINLNEQPDIKTLLHVLESNGLKKEQQEVETFVDFLESMGNQFSQMIGELQAVRGELEKMQDRGVRATVSHAVESAGNGMRQVLEKVSMIGKNLIRSAKYALAVFKEKGINALRKAVSDMKIPLVLSFMKSMLHHGAEKMNKKAETTQVLAQEIYKAKEHRRNVGRILIGRRVKEPTEQVVDRGILAKVEKTFLFCGRMYAGMERMADRALQRVWEFSQGKAKKPSVKADLKQLKNQKTTQRNAPTTKEEQIR